MSKRSLALVAVVLVVSVLYTVVAHACSDLNSMQAILDVPCDHKSAQDEPVSKSEKDNCDTIRYGMLSAQAALSHTELFNLLHSSPVYQALLVGASLLADSLVFCRPQGPPFPGPGVSQRLSHVVLRI